MKALNQAMQCNMVVVCHNLLHNISMSSISHRIPLPTTFKSSQKYKKKWSIQVLSILIELDFIHSALPPSPLDQNSIEFCLGN